MALSAVRETDQFFPGYRFRYSREEDFSVVMKIMEGEGIDLSKKEAVYPRNSSMVRWGVSNGLFSIVERCAQSEAEFVALGNNSSRVIAITGAYLLGLDKDAVQHKFPVERPYRGSHPAESFVLEVGSTRYLKEWDLPNRQGYLPSNCLYPVVVAGTVLQAFHLVGEVLTSRELRFDAITANVQLREELLGTMTRLQRSPLNFGQIVPSNELKTYTGSTTEGSTFERYLDKIYLHFQADKLPAMAAYMLERIESRHVSSELGDTTDTLGIEFQIDDKFKRTLFSILRRSDWLQTQAGASFTDVKRRMYMPPEPVIYAKPVTPSFAAMFSENDGTGTAHSDRDVEAIGNGNSVHTNDGAELNGNDGVVQEAAGRPASRLSSLFNYIGFGDGRRSTEPDSVAYEEPRKPQFESPSRLLNLGRDNC